MTDSLSEMQSFEIEKPKIDFTQPPHVISREILKLPLAEQQHWIDLWLEQPDMKADRELREKQRKEAEMVHPKPINIQPPDKNWQD